MSSTMQYPAAHLQHHHHGHPDPGMPVPTPNALRPSLAGRRTSSSRATPYTLRHSSSSSSLAEYSQPTFSSTDPHEPGKLGPLQTVHTLDAELPSHDEEAAQPSHYHDPWHTLANTATHAHHHARSASISSVASTSSDLSGTTTTSSSSAWSTSGDGQEASRNTSVDYSNIAAPAAQYPAYGHPPAFSFPAPPSHPSCQLLISPQKSTRSNTTSYQSETSHYQDALGSRVNAGTLDPALANCALAIHRTAGTSTTAEKARIAFVHTWLQSSFVRHPEGNVSRQALYGSYLEQCAHYGVAPINAASYGKAVRSCWPGIKTRRLGVRGASRYHYCGIRPASVQVEDMVARHNALPDQSGNPVPAPIPGWQGEGFPSLGEEHGGCLPDRNAAGHSGGLPNMNMEKICLTLPQQQQQQHNSMHYNHYAGADEATGTSSISSMGMPTTMSTGRSYSHPEIQYSSSASPSLGQKPNTGDTNKMETSSEFELSPHDNAQRAPWLAGSVNSRGGIPSGMLGPELVQQEQAYDHSSVDEPGFFSSNSSDDNSHSLRRQVSAPSLVHPRPTLPLVQGLDNNYRTVGSVIGGSDFFADLKTPTAIQFLRECTDQLARQDEGGTTETKEEPEADGDDEDEEGDSVMGGDDEAGTEDHKGAHGELEQLGTQQRSVPDFEKAQRWKGRRATVPDLSIRIPPLPAQAQPHTSVEASGNKQYLFPETARAPSFSGIGAVTHLGSRALEACVLPSALRVALPSFDEVCNEAGTGTGLKDPFMDKGAIELLWNGYKTEHCHSLLKLIASGRYDEFEAATMLFWSSLDATQQALVQHPLLNQAMYRADTQVFAAVLSHLSEVLLSSSSAPDRAAQIESLQRLGDALENVTVSGLEAFPAVFSGGRIELASRTAHLLQRLLGMVQLVKALGDILAQPNSVQDLLASWQTIDFESVANQAALVAGWVQETVLRCIEDCYTALSGLESVAEPVKALMAFADGALARSSTSGNAHPPDDSKAGRKSRAKKFLLKWSYISRQIGRDLLLKSNSSFGAFQIISLFLDEWIAFTVLKGMVLDPDAVHASVSHQDIPSTQSGQQSRPVIQHAQQHSHTAFKLTHDVSAFLVSPNPAGFGFGELAAQQLQRSISQPSQGHLRVLPSSNTMVDPSAVPSQVHGTACNALLVPSLAYNFASILSPTTRAIFGDAKTPVYLNFAHVQPNTPSAMAMQFSPRGGFPSGSALSAGGARQAFTTTTTSTSFSFDDFQLPLPSPARFPLGYSYR